MSIVFVPYPVPVPMRGNGVGWERRRETRTFRHLASGSPVSWSCRRKAIPVPLTISATRRTPSIADAKRLIARRDRASKLLRELNSLGCATGDKECSTQAAKVYHDALFEMIGCSAIK